MKKAFYFAAALLAVAACSKNEVVEMNRGEAIGFRTVVSGNTKVTDAHDVTTANLSGFIVTAMTDASTPAVYFENVEYTKQTDASFTSQNKYYWPASGTLTFYAYAPNGATGVARSDYKTWAVTQDTDGTTQPDLVVAKNSGTKSANASGVVLNFRHAMAKLSLQVKNSNTGMKMEVKNWKVAYVYDKGTFAIADSETNTNGNNTGTGTTLLAADWTYTDATQAVTNEVTGVAATTPIAIAAAGDGDPVVTPMNAASGKLGKDFIVIPQTMKSGSPAYVSTDAGAAWTTPYIAVLMTIKNNTTAGEVIAAEQWCCWPISTTWEPGKHYTYTIDLADGGYKETNVVGSDASAETTALDPVLDNAEIKFVTVTVDNWTEATGISVPTPTPGA